MGTKTKNSPNTLTWEEVMALDLKGHSLEAKEDGVACSGPIKEVKFGPEEKIIFCLEWIEFEGKARVFDKKTNAKLKVSFFWPFAGDYWIIELGKDYEYVIVGEQTRKYLWILARNPVMDETVYNDILKRTAQKGFDVSKLEKNPQKLVTIK